MTMAARRNGGSAGACEPHISLTHEAELKHDWEAGQGMEMCCVSLCWLRWGLAGGIQALLRSAQPRNGGTAWGAAEPVLGTLLSTFFQPSGKAGCCAPAE